MSETFTSAFKQVRDLLAEDEDFADSREYLTAPERVKEAEEAEPCVERFVDYEFDPPEATKKGAGRGKARWPMADPIAKSLTNQLKEMDDAEREWMRDTITFSMAFPYVTGCVVLGPMEEWPDPTLGGDPGELWERWMLQLSSNYLSEHLTKPMIETALGWAHFENAMKKHGVYQLKTAPAIKLLSGTYGRAGLTLRLLQCTDKLDLEPHKKTVAELPNWPFERS
jgi:hypothetical protein